MRSAGILGQGIALRGPFGSNHFSLFPSLAATCGEPFVHLLWCQRFAGMFILRGLLFGRV